MPLPDACRRASATGKAQDAVAKRARSPPPIPSDALVDDGARRSGMDAGNYAAAEAAADRAMRARSDDRSEALI